MMTRALGTGSAQATPSTESERRTDAGSLIVSRRKKEERGRASAGGVAPALQTARRTYRTMITNGLVLRNSIMTVPSVAGS